MLERKKVDLAFMRFPGFCGKVLTFSYDDGLKLDEQLVAILQKNGLKGTFNLNSGMFAESSNENNIHARMTKEECIRLFANSENEIAIHGYRHLPLATLASTEIVYETISDKATLENIFGCVIRGMAYSNGSYNEAAVEVLKKCGIRYARTVEDTGNFDLPEDWMKMHPTCHHNSPRLMEIAKQFAELNYEEEWTWSWFSKTPKMFCVWGHSSEFGRDQNWNVIEEFAEYLGNRKDIWYATIGEICEYTQAYKALQFSADGTLVYNPSAIDIYMSRFGKKYIVHSGETVRF